MAEQQTTTKKRSASAASTDGAAPKRSSQKSEEKGVDLLAVLMKQVEDQIAGVKRAPNKSETYTRLQTADGKTFAYIFPPREHALAVKIPKQLLSIAESLPKGHGFHPTSWGLTRTITKASEVPSVSKAFVVAAAAVAPAQEGGEA